MCSFTQKVRQGWDLGVKVAELDAARESHIGESDHILLGEGFKGDFVENKVVAVGLKEFKVVDLSDEVGGRVSSWSSLCWWIS